MMRPLPVETLTMTVASLKSAEKPRPDAGPLAGAVVSRVRARDVLDAGECAPDTVAFLVTLPRRRGRPGAGQERGPQGVPE